ncbi:MAG: tetratricopeptide repeat protein [Myxococcota bacterium]|nr:tetratricopeptide repeat protein [Myxococcota bacterium]
MDRLQHGAACLLVLLLVLFVAPGCGDPGYAPVQKAEALAVEGRWEEAAEAFRSLPDESEVWRPYGDWRAATIYRDLLGDPTRAEAAFTDCFRAHPQHDWGYSCRVQLGHLRRDRGDPRGAIDAYRGALQLRPRGGYSEVCLLESGRAYLQMGEAEQARLEWQELMEKFPTSPLEATVSLDRARSYDLQGLYREALKAYREVQTRYPGHSVVGRAAFGEGEALEQLGRLEEARGIFEELRYTHPNPEAVEIKIAALIRRIERRKTAQTGAWDTGDFRGADEDDEEGSDRESAR